MLPCSATFPSLPSYLFTGTSYPTLFDELTPPVPVDIVFGDKFFAGVPTEVTTVNVVLSFGPGSYILPIGDPAEVSNGVTVA